MSKTKTAYVCSECGAEHSKWSGQCSQCKQWNTVTELKIPITPPAGRSHASWTGAPSTTTNLRDVKGTEHARSDTGMAELNRVLGGGLVAGSVVFISGEPGIGKSTLLLQTLANYSKTGKVCYVSGEESLTQIRLRSERLGLADADITMSSETEIERILPMLEAEKPQITVIDSIQVMYSSNSESAPGSISQLKECTTQLTRYAKSPGGGALFIVGHVTKEGDVAGPRILEHIVDAVLLFETEPGSQFRMLRASKNRFGAVNDMGVFLMGEQGLEEVSNPSSMFLTQHEKPVPGCCVFAAMAGNRPFMVEVQALVEETPSPNPRRYASGFDMSRLQMLLAILNKHAGLPVFDQNVYLKVVGGVKITEPGSDMGAILAVYSSLTGKPMPERVVVFGEVGLAGEVRPVQDAEGRLREAAKLGFKTAIIPAGNKIKTKIPGIEVRQVSRIGQALDQIRELKNAA